jgi:hypothetical protein
VALVVTGLAALALALYVRYALVEPATVGLACDAGAETTDCVVRQVFIGLFRHFVLGSAAMLMTLLALIRPNVLLAGAALACGLLGAVLYNTGLSALALGLLPLVLARPAPPREFRPD